MLIMLCMNGCPIETTFCLQSWSMMLLIWGIINHCWFSGSFNIFNALYSLSFSLYHCIIEMGLSGAMQKKVCAVYGAALPVLGPWVSTFILKYLFSLSSMQPGLRMLVYCILPGLSTNNSIIYYIFTNSRL